MPDLSAFHAGGKVAALMRDHDWSETALGPIGNWPQSLRSALGISLRSASASAIFWGADHLFLYNDAWAELLGERHPGALGQPARQIWADAWDLLEPRFRAAYETAETVTQAGLRMMRPRDGRLVETYWTYSLLPLGNEQGNIGGLLGQVWETTASVMRARQETLVQRLVEALRTHDEAEALIEVALDLLNEELGADRICFSEVDEQTGSVRLLKCVRGSSMGGAGASPPNWWLGTQIEDELEAGRAVRIENVAGDKRLTDVAAGAGFQEIGTGAALLLPVPSGARARAVIVAHLAEPTSWSDQLVTMLSAACRLIGREVARARAQTALARSEERHRSLFEQANDIIFTADLDQIVTDCNPAGAQAMGLPREEIIGRSIADFVSPAGFSQTMRMLRQKLEEGGATRHEIDVLLPNGQVLHWEINSSLARDAGGKPVGLHAIARDVTERRQNEARQRLLVDELNHRVKNTLALVQGLALQTFKDGRDAGDARAIFQERLAALAVAHDLLTRECWEGVTIAELVEQTVSHYGGGDHIDWNGPPIRLAPKAAVSLVMALHELATNAAKYGSLSVPGGRVALRWESSPEPRLSMTWAEAGGPPVVAPTRRGFGLRMIERALASDFAGKAHFDFAPGGLTCRLEAALEEVSVGLDPS
jgi:PAS domain S-box-containing protein